MYVCFYACACTVFLLHQSVMLVTSYHVSDIINYKYVLDQDVIIYILNELWCEGIATTLVAVILLLK